MGSMTIAHGATQDAHRWSERVGLKAAAETADVELILPQSNRFMRVWRPQDMRMIADASLDSSMSPIILGGFSRGARHAMNAALYLVDQGLKVNGVIFHSGHWKASELPSQEDGLPFHLLCLGGARDLTTKLPNWAGTDPHGLAKYYKPSFYGSEVTWHEHPGKHSWGPVNDFVFEWIDQLT